MGHHFAFYSGYSASELDLVDDIQCDVFAHWKRIRGDALMPARTAFDPLDVFRALPMIFLAENRSNGAWFFRVVGTGIATHTGFEASGRWLTELGARLDVAEMERDFNAVAKAGQPARHVTGLPVVGRDWMLFDRLLLPLGHARTVTHLLGVCRFKD